ncbi:MAG: UDP-3-O-acyl-N-acetylglucosamine deacetylase [Proteobacteria bacterium]|nr:UDP-3-O-acyl-N-acetylglucosamine deacetylase [Pseudomonadota bacterium]
MKSVKGEAAYVRQRTLKSAIHCNGIGLHTGTKVSMTLHPGDPDTGIVFRRTDISGSDTTIPATWRNVVDDRLCTSLGNDDGVCIGSIEHLMAALSGCDIDNAVVEVNGPEVPVMDGSAAPFVFLIECAGVVEQERPRRALEILKRVTVGNHQRRASLAPGKNFSISFEIEFESPVIARQECTIIFANGTFKSDICRARTFGFEHEVTKLRETGFARGGSLDNAIVVSGDNILNQGGLRYDNEFVRHKVLDCIGDLYLCGGPILGHFHGYRSGHSVTHRLLKALFADDQAWRYTPLKDDLQASENRQAASVQAPA